jgi:septation ring formation regulator
MFELKNMLEFLESLFQEFDSEKTGKKDYDEDKAIFDSRVDKLTEVINSSLNEMNSLKNNYDLSEADIKNLNVVNDKLEELKEVYKKDTKELGKKKITYSVIADNMKGYLIELRSIEEETESILNNFGNMQDDEERAKEQLKEIQELLRQSKLLIRSYKLPVITNNYYVELSEANEAITEIIKELNNKPISIKTLNTRVDTGRDLTLKLFNTANEMVKTAKLAEYSIVYGNRYRKEDINIDNGLNQSTLLYNKGNYKKSLDVTVNTLERVDKEIKGRISEMYEKNS